MRLFSPLYDRALAWAGHRHAAWYLGGLSFAESSFFPVPPDVMLAPMTLARPERWWKLAALTTLTSAAGGLLGYAIGYFALDLVTPWLHRLGWWAGYLEARAWFDAWGIWVVFLAGFSPIPYKLFTIASGAAAMALLPFTVASLVGRGARFFMVAALVRALGPRVEPVLRRHVDLIGWSTVVAAVILWLVLAD